MSYLSLSFLGRYEVILDAEPATAFGADKARALLAFLAIESSHPHRRAKLAGMFWPDLPEKKAAHNLSQSLLRLRQTLRENADSKNASYFIVSPQDIQFNTFADYQLDVTRFRNLLKLNSQHHHIETANCKECAQWLRQAVELYQGDLLAGLFVSDSVAFEEWRMTLQEELRQRALTALNWLADYHAQKGEYEQAQDYARRQIVLAPWQEEAHLQLMQALFQSGQASGALKHYDTYQRKLAKELNLKPSAELSKVYERVRAAGKHSSAPTTTLPAGPAEASWLSSQGERRQITALVCSWHTPDDSDDADEQMTPCEHYCGVIFNRFGGRRTPRRGSACLVYFGYPQAYEDAARRAVHSSLALAATLADNETIRIGIHTGLVTIGEKQGEQWKEREIFGKALEIARDCQRLARPGEILITEETRRLVQDVFDLDALEQGTPAGIPGQMAPIYRVREEIGLRNRFDWLAQTQRLTTFAGREEELNLLKYSCDSLLQGKGRAVLLSGEPGIGKSRLVRELKNSLLLVGAASGEMHGARPAIIWLTSRCLPHYKNTSLHPMIGLLEGLIGIQADDSPAARLDKLKGMLAWYSINRSSSVWLMSLLLGLPTDMPAPETITESQRAQMRDIFITLVQKRAAEQPIVMEIEDLHWSDSSTIGWLGLSINSLATVPCLVLLTARPEFNPGWLADKNLQSNLSLLTIHRLQADQAEKMVTDLMQVQTLADAIKRQIIALSDGTPLFIEEITKTFLEQKTFKGLASGATNIPVTLLDLLTMRLDHLGAAKETAQWASVLGREFSYSILRACLPYDEQRLQRDLAHLIESELIAPIKHAQPHNRAQDLYAFKHALMQEAAYASMLKPTRQNCHKRIAETLETRFEKYAEIQPEVLAGHYSNAGQQSKAIDFWLLAGERAISQGATQEARAFFDHALDGINPLDHERHWRALGGREQVLDTRGERAAQEADLTALLELAEVFDDDTRRSQVYLRQTAYVATLGDFRATLPLADAARLAARRAGNLNLESRALAYKAQTLIFLREMDSAREAVDEALSQLQNLDDHSEQALVLTVAAQYSMETGDLVRSVQLQVQSAEAAQQAGKRVLEITIRANLGLIFATLGLYAQAQTVLETALATADALGDRRLQASARRHLGYVHGSSDNITLAVQMEQQALEEMTGTNDAYGEAACLAYLGYFLEASGQLVLAAEHLIRAQEIFGEIGVEADKFEAQATQARVALRQGKHDEARQLTLSVWNYLRENGTEGLSSPAWIYVCIADVLAEISIPDISSEQVIEIGYQDLMQRAEKISDIDWRQSFLENVSENRAIVEMWEKINKPGRAE